MSIFSRIFKPKEKTTDQVFRTHQDWVFWLTAGWLLVTFEHLHYTVSQYTISHTWNIMDTEIPIGAIKSIAFVILLEVTLFWSVMFIPATKRLNVKKIMMHVIQGIGVLVSMFLNIKYMIIASPTPDTLDVTIGAVLGGLVPIFVVLFGYVEGQLVESQYGEQDEPKADIDENSVAQLKANGALVRGYKRDNPHLSIRELAYFFNIPQEEIQKYLDEGRQYDETKSDT